MLIVHSCLTKYNQEDKLLSKFTLEDLCKGSINIKLGRTYHQGSIAEYDCSLDQNSIIFSRNYLAESINNPDVFVSVNKFYIPTDTF